MHASLSMPPWTLGQDRFVLVKRSQCRDLGGEGCWWVFLEVGRQGAEGGARTWHLSQILALFPDKPWEFEAVWICAII